MAKVMNEETVYINGEPFGSAADFRFADPGELHYGGLRSIEAATTTMTTTIERTRKNRRMFAALECFMNGVKQHRSYRVTKRWLSRSRKWEKTERARAHGSHGRRTLEGQTET